MLLFTIVHRPILYTVFITIWLSHFFAELFILVSMLRLSVLNMSVIYLDDQIKRDEMGMHVACLGERGMQVCSEET